MFQTMRPYKAEVSNLGTSSFENLTRHITWFSV